MDNATFDMVDGMLARQGHHDDRPAAEDILEVGIKEGTLVDAARVVAGRYALRPEVVIEWYTEVLNRRVQEATAIIEKLNEMTRCRVGYCVKKQVKYGGGRNKDLEAGRCPICKEKLGKVYVGDR